MRVAVTGGSGVVGRTLVRHLVASGRQVVAMARSEASAAELADLGAAPVRGDVLDTESLKSLVGGADWVFHVAGINRMCVRDPSEMFRVNIEGALAVASACRDEGVRRLIHTSSAVTLGQLPGEVGSEETLHRGTYLSRYEESKHKAEVALLGESMGIEVVVVNPSSVQGPGRATGTGRLIIDAINGKLPALINSPISLVDIDDCARGHLLAAERGVPGERYVLSGVSTTVAEAVAAFVAETGREMNPRFLPGWVAAAGAAVIEASAMVTGTEAKVCREMVRVLRAGAAYDGSRATRELGLVYTSFARMVQRSVAWYRHEGLIA